MCRTLAQALSKRIAGRKATTFPRLKSRRSPPCAATILPGQTSGTGNMLRAGARASDGNTITADDLAFPVRPNSQRASSRRLRRFAAAGGERTRVEVQGFPAIWTRPTVTWRAIWSRSKNTFWAKRWRRLAEPDGYSETARHQLSQSALPAQKLGLKISQRRPAQYQSEWRLRKRSGRRCR